MGLDMYLYKVKKPQPSLNLNLSAEDISLIDSYLNYLNDEQAKNYTFEQWTGRSSLPSQELIDAYTPELQVRYDSYDTKKQFPHASIVTMIQDWRKANAIHDWFVRHTQDGLDECQPSFVTKENFEELLETCRKIIHVKNDQAELEVIAKNILPTASGFFFGSTDYDEYYVYDIEDTVETIESILKEDDFDKYYYIYQASW